MSILRRDLIIEILLVSLIIAGFIFITIQKIGFHPVPWKDEPWLMQPAYEVVKNGQMSSPMFRHFGNELGERTFTDPVFTYLLAIWFRCFGFGMLEARLFNLTLSIGVLLLVYLIARLLAGRTAGVIAISFLVLDNNYLTGSRFLRNDFASIFFALAAAFSYLKAKYLIASQNKFSSRLWLVASGLLATMSALSHLNGLYIIVLLAIWLFIDYRFRMFIKLEPWVVAISINLLALPYTIYCWVNREVYLAQWNTFAAGRTRGTTASGLWLNVLAEPKRYLDWNYGIVFIERNPMVQLFKFLTIIAIIYLLAKIIWQLWKKIPLTTSSYIYLLTAIFWTVTFFATEVSNKTHSYLPHITTWFALAIGIFGQDLFLKMISWTPELIKYLPEQERPKELADEQKILARVFFIGLSILVAIYIIPTGILLIKYQRYLATIEPTKYNKMATELVNIVSPELTPIGIPNYWHLFAVKRRDDYRAFSRRLIRKVLKGEFPDEQYAFIADKRQQRKLLAIVEDLGLEAKRKVRLMTELPDTPYGKVWVYYIGTDEKFLNP